MNDEYTEYLTKDEYEDLLIAVTGDYTGIGIYMAKTKDENVVILYVIEDSPAEEAGLQAGDIILSVDGAKCTDNDINIIGAQIKGKEGTNIDLEILRENETINKTIQRRKIEMKDSNSQILEEKIGYIELVTFDEGCSENISNYLQEFKDNGIESVIIDLRNNSGGVVDEAIKVAELFVNRGDVIMRSYDKTKKETVITSNNTKPADMKFIILVNEYSASATEIVTAALQDNELATVVGTKTFGKGVMQEVIPLTDINLKGALKVTIEEFKTPNGDTINKIGITPDVIIEDNSETKEDEQLEKAIEMLK